MCGTVTWLLSSVLWFCVVFFFMKVVRRRNYQGVLATHVFASASHMFVSKKICNEPKSPPLQNRSLLEEKGYLNYNTSTCAKLASIDDRISLYGEDFKFPGKILTCLVECEWVGGWRMASYWYYCKVVGSYALVTCIDGSPAQLIVSTCICRWRWACNKRRHSDVTQGEKRVFMGWVCQEAIPKENLMWWYRSKLWAWHEGTCVGWKLSFQECVHVFVSSQFQDDWRKLTLNGWVQSMCLAWKL